MSNTNELQHHGILGMKWGVRRYQNKDGSLTPAGKRKAAKMKDDYTKLTGKKLIKKPTKKKSISEMTNEELISITNRLNAEKNYIEAVNSRNAVNPKHVSKGRKFINTIKNDVIIPAATDTAKQLVKSYMVKNVNKFLELDNEHKVYTNNKKKS